MSRTKIIHWHKAKRRSTNNTTACTVRHFSETKPTTTPYPVYTQVFLFLVFFEHAVAAAILFSARVTLLHSNFFKSPDLDEHSGKFAVNSYINVMNSQSIEVLFSENLIILTVSLWSGDSHVTDSSV